MFLVLGKWLELNVFFTSCCCLIVQIHSMAVFYHKFIKVLPNYFRQVLM